MNKKLLLGLGSISTAIMPIVAVVSCSTEPSQSEKVIDRAIRKLKSDVNNSYKLELFSAEKAQEELERDQNKEEIKILGVDRKNSFGADITYKIKNVDNANGIMNIEINSNTNGNKVTKSFTIDGFVKKAQYDIDNEIKLGEIKDSSFLEVKQNNTLSIEEAIKALSDKNVNEIEKFVSFFPDATNSGKSVFKTNLSNEEFTITNVRKNTFSGGDSLDLKRTLINISFDVFVTKGGKKSSTWTVTIPFNKWDEVINSNGTYTKDTYINAFQELEGNLGNWTYFNQIQKYSTDQVTNELLGQWLNKADSLKTGTWVYDVSSNAKKFIENEKTYNFKEVIKVANSDNSNDGSIEIQLTYENTNDATDKIIIKGRVWGFDWGTNKNPSNSNF